MIRRFLNKIEGIYKYRYFSKNEQGAYRFLLKKVYKSTDIDFVEKIWQLDYFREVLEPMELPIKDLRRVLVLAPHQDDELLGCGGTLLQLSQAGCQIYIGFLTNGAELSNPVESVAIRHKEATEVCKLLKSNMMELGIDNVTMQVEKEHVETLKEWIEQPWDAIFTVWPLDQPPKHRICSYLLGKVLDESNEDKVINFYSVHTDLLPNFYRDITDDIDTKEKLLALYASQMANQRLDHLSRGLDAWRSRFLPVSGKARYIETFTQIPAVAYKDIQKIYESSNKRKLFKANDACIESFNRLRKL